MIKRIISFIIVTSLALIVTGCGPSEEEVLENIKNTFHMSFDREITEPNANFDHFNIYFPEEFAVVEETESNFIFADQDRTYILFYNLLEDPTSDAFFIAEQEREQYILLESYQDEKRFAYVRIDKLEEDYELQLGVGGVRITTQTSLPELENTFDKLIQMVRSIDFTKEEVK